MRVGLLGHSEGAEIATMVAASDPTIAFAVLLAAPALPGDELLLSQSRAILRAQGATPEKVADAVAANRDIYAIAKSDAPTAELEARVEARLTQAGVPPENIVPLADGAVEFDELIYPTPITVQPWVKAPRVIKFLEALVRSMPQPRPSPKKIYVTRGPRDSRRLMDEEPIARIMTDAGYQVVNPGILDFAGQVQMFREATHVVGILGAGLSNLVFAPRGVQLLALTSETMQDDFFWDLICHKAGSYTSLHGKAIDPDAGMRSHFTLDEAAFLKCFVAFDSTP